MSGIAPGPYPSAPQPFAPERNLPLLLAQLLAVVQAVLAMIGGAQTLRAQFLFGVIQRIGAPINVGNELLVDGVIIMGLGALVGVAGLFAGRGSSLVRGFLILWELVAFLFTLGFLLDFGSLLQLRDGFIVLAYGAGIGFVHPLIALAIEAAIIYGLVVHPAIRNGFAR
ncbi:MAG TPA: hypothetical protein VF155_07235 [Candidatus Dormibacteraeota bacterium]